MTSLMKKQFLGNPTIKNFTGDRKISTDQVSVLNFY